MNIKLNHSKIDTLHKYANNFEKYIETTLNILPCEKNKLICFLRGENENNIKFWSNKYILEELLLVNYIDDLHYVFNDVFDFEAYSVIISAILECIRLHYNYNRVIFYNKDNGYYVYMQ